jgi:hypothetical protein
LGRRLADDGKLNQEGNDRVVHIVRIVKRLEGTMGMRGLEEAGGVGA